MISPYALYYDAVMSSVAVFILFLLGDRRGFLIAEKFILVLIWLAPVSLAYLTRDHDISVMYITYMMLIFSCFRRYRAEVAT